MAGTRWVHESGEHLAIPPATSRTTINVIDQAAGTAPSHPTIALTNEPSSELAAASEHVVDLRAGSERAVAATKTYVAELAAVAALVMTAIDDRSKVRQLDRLPEALAVTVESAESWLAVHDDLAASFSVADRCLVVSRGFNLATAQEIALKLKETSRTFAEGYSSADLMHGPVFLAGADVPTLAMRTSDAA